MYGIVEAREYPSYEWFGYTIGQQIADENIDGKPYKRLKTFLMILEGEMFIEQIAAYTPKEIVGS